QLAAGLLDIAHQIGSAVNAAFFAHEADAAVAVHGKALHPRNAGTEGSLHCCSPRIGRRRFAIRLVLRTDLLYQGQCPIEFFQIPRYASRTRRSPWMSAAVPSSITLPVSST